MRNMLYLWRWYTLGREQYRECMKKTFINNLNSLRQVNIVVVVLASCFAVSIVAIGNSLFMAAGHLITAGVSLLLVFFVNFKLNQVRQGKRIHNLLIYILMTVYFVNIIVFGIYLGVWANPGNFAVTFMCILICALYLFVNPPLYNLCLVLIAMVAFIAATVLIKSSEHWIADVINVLGAGCISLFFGWQITKLRLVSVLTESELEDERNKYYNQSTIDELTGLKNRRDFMQTFQRYLNNYRTSDDWLCIALADIDFFKNYNDHYGHPKGDECLRVIGVTFNGLRDSMGVYAARVGGEEFALLWFEKEAAHVKSVVSQIHDAIRALKIPHESSKVAPYVTISTGIYVERLGASSDAHSLYDLADQALYTAKRSGRNCAVVSGRSLKEYKITPA